MTPLYYFDENDNHFQSLIKKNMLHYIGNPATGKELGDNPLNTASWREDKDKTGKEHAISVSLWKQ